MTFVLDATNKTIKFTITASAGADVHFTSHWADATASGLTEGQTQGTSNGSTAVDAVPAPAATTRRVVKLITFHNTNVSTSRTVTLVNDVGGTSRTIAVFTLAPLATWYSDTAATTAIADGDKGDITVSGSGATWTIDNNAITFAKIADITSGNILGRTGEGSGPVQEITPGPGVLTWLQTPTSDNLRSAVTGDTGTGNLVFANGPTITNPEISSGGLRFTSTSTTTPQLMTARASGVPFDARFAFQTNEVDGATVWTMLPNGNGTSSQFAAQNTAHRTNFSFANMVARSTSIGMRAAAAGTGALLPLQLEVPSVRMTIDPNGNIGINTTSFGTSSMGVIAIANAVANPTTNPSGGGVLYVVDGALRWRGPQTETVIAPR